MGQVIKPVKYEALLDTKQTEQGIKLIKEFFQQNLSTELRLRRVTAPLFVLKGLGINDDLNGVERAVTFPIKDLGDAQAEVVHSLAKWKRLSLAEYKIEPGYGIYTDMNAIRADEELDNLHSLYVDQWDWEAVIRKEDRTLSFLKNIVERIYSAIRRTEYLTCETYHEHGTISLADSILALLGRLVGIHLQQFLSMYKVNLLGQEGLDLRIGLAGQIFRSADGRIDTLHDILQERQRAVFLADHGLPVPLVHIERMQVVELLISTDGVHIGIDTIARLYLILSQRKTLPLGQRVNHLSLRITQILDGECHSTLHTVQVVVDTQSFQHEQGCRHTTQSQFCGEVLLEELLDKFDALFCLSRIKQRIVMYRFDYLSHMSVYA